MPRPVAHSLELSVCLRCQCRQLIGQAWGRSRNQRRFPRIDSPRFSSSQHAVEEADDFESYSEESKYSLIKKWDPYNGRLKRKPQYTKTPLGVTSLGDPAEALVLQKFQKDHVDQGLLRSGSSETTLPEQADSGFASLLDEIRSERLEPEKNDSYANINALRDAYLRMPEGRERAMEGSSSALFKALFRGFEKNHLVDYILRSKPPAQNKDSLNIDRPYASIFFSRSPWKPTTAYQMPTTAPEIADKPLAEYQTIPSEAKLLQMSKKSLVLSVMQICWNLHPKQQHLLPGQLTLRVQLNHLNLILSHNQDPLTKISELHHARFQVSQEDGYLTILATYEIAKSALRAVVEVLERIDSSVIDIALRPSNEAGDMVPVDKSYIESISKLTDTVITPLSSEGEMDTSSNSYLIQYLGPERADFENAQRLLKTGNEASDDLLKHTGNIVMHSPTSPPSLTPIPVSDHIPLSRRHISWGRFTSPVTSGPVFSSDHGLGYLERDVYTNGISAGLAIEIQRFLQDDKTSPVSSSFSPRDTQFWSPSLTLQSSANFGLVAWPLNEAPQIVAGPEGDIGYKQFDFRGKRINRFLVNKVSGLAELLLSAQTTPGKRSHPLAAENIVIKLKPELDSQVPPQSVKELPNLEIRLAVDDPSERPYLDYARFEVQQANFALALPANVSDIQFRKTWYIYSKAKDIDPRLVDFVESSDLDLEGPTRLKTPNHLRITVPRQAIPNLLDPGRREHFESLEVRYAFAGLEHRSSMHLQLPSHDNYPRADLEPCTTVYELVEAGKAGGRREELVVRGRDGSPDDFATLGTHSDRQGPESYNERRPLAETQRRHEQAKHLYMTTMGVGRKLESQANKNRSISPSRGEFSFDS